MADETTPFKVMVVEDDEDVARAIARKLGSDGHEVELASDPRGVLARTHSRKAATTFSGS